MKSLQRAHFRGLPAFAGVVNMTLVMQSLVNNVPYNRLSCYDHISRVHIRRQRIRAGCVGSVYGGEEVMWYPSICLSHWVNLLGLHNRVGTLRPGHLMASANNDIELDLVITVTQRTS